MKGERGYPEIWFDVGLSETRPVPTEVQRWFDRGAATCAAELLEALDETESHPSDRCRFKPVEIAYLAYALLHWCITQDIDVPADLMRLLWRLLRLDTGPTPPDPVAERFGWPAARNLDKFFQAIDVEAEEPQVSLNALSQRVDVDRRTLRDWRRGEPYQGRLRGIRALTA